MPHPRLDKCPVCRAAFSAHLLLTSRGDAEEARGAEVPGGAEEAVRSPLHDTAAEMAAAETRTSQGPRLISGRAESEEIEIREALVKPRAARNADFDEHDEEAGL